MADVSFEEEQFNRRPVYPSSGPKGLIGLTIRLGLAADERSAERVLLIIAGVAVAATIGIFIMTSAPEPERTSTQPLAPLERAKK